MRIHLISLLALACVFDTPTEASAAQNPKAQAPSVGQTLTTIPNQFQGNWREAQSQCGDMTETGLDISPVAVKYYGHSPKAKSIRQTGPYSITIVYTARNGSRSENWTADYEISVDGRTLTEIDVAGDRIRRVRCDENTAPEATSQPVTITIDSLLGYWGTGGSACASIQRGHTATYVFLLAWYCEAGEQSATPITLGRLGDRVFRHEASGVSLVIFSDRMMQIMVGPRSRAVLGDGLFVAEAGRFYNKQVSTSQVSKVLSPSQLPMLRKGAFVRHTGAYATHSTACQQASNATLEWWNGQFFSGGRKHPAYPRWVGPDHRYVANVKGWEDNKTYQVTFDVLNVVQYVRDGVRFSFCEEAMLPSGWRNSMPPQTAAPAGTSMQPLHSGMDKLGFMERRHAGPLAAFLSQNTFLRMAQASDLLEWDQLRSQFQSLYGNDHPYYAFGDFNRDGFEDFAVVLVDMTVGAKPRNYRDNESRYYNASVAVFNGSSSGYANRPNFMQKWGLVQSSLLLYTHNQNFLGIGQWEGPVAQVKPERSGTYRYYYGE